MYRFEFDDNKSASNLSKYGINFVSFQAISSDEHHFLVIACIDNQHWPAEITYRGNKIRIILVRRSRKLTLLSKNLMIIMKVFLMIWTYQH